MVLAEARQIGFTREKDGALGAHQLASGCDETRITAAAHLRDICILVNRSSPPLHDSCQPAH
jgi:hypothetical protein